MYLNTVKRSFMLFIVAIFTATSGMAHSVKVQDLLPRDLINQLFGVKWQSNEKLTVEYLASEDFYRRSLEPGSDQQAMRFIRTQLSQLGLTLNMSDQLLKLYENNPEHPLFQKISFQKVHHTIRKKLHYEADAFTNPDLSNLIVLDFLKIYFFTRSFNGRIAFVKGPARMILRQALQEKLGLDLMQYLPRSTLEVPLRKLPMPPSVAAAIRYHNLVTVEQFLDLVDNDEFSESQGVGEYRLREVLNTIANLGLEITLPETLSGTTTSKREDPRFQSTVSLHLPKITFETLSSTFGIPHQQLLDMPLTEFVPMFLGTQLPDDHLPITSHPRKTRNIVQKALEGELGAGFEKNYLPNDKLRWPVALLTLSRRLQFALKHFGAASVGDVMHLVHGNRDFYYRFLDRQTFGEILYNLQRIGIDINAHFPPLMLEDVRITPRKAPPTLRGSAFGRLLAETENILLAAGIENIDQLQALSDSQLLTMPGMTVAAIADIHELLRTVPKRNFVDTCAALFYLQ